MRSFKLHNIFTLFFLVAFLAACGGGTAFNDDDIEHVELHFGDQHRLFYKADATNQNSNIHGYIGDFATPGKAHFHIESDNDWLIDNFTLRFELHSMEFSIGEHRNVVSAKVLDKIRDRTYETELRFEFLTNRISIKEFGEVGGWIRGTFELQLCVQEAIQTGRCDIAENVITVSGHFNLKRDADELAKSQGTQNEPQSLGSAPLLSTTKSWFSLHRASSYYKISVNPEKSYRVELRPKNADLILKIFGSDTYSQPLCEKSGDSELITCDIPANQLSTLHIEVKALKAIDDPHYFQMEVFDIHNFSSEGTAQAPITIGDIDHEKFVYHGSVGTARSPIPSNEIVKRYGSSFYRARVQAGHNYGFSLANTSQNSLSTYVFDNSYHLLCAATAGEVCPVYTAENTLIVVVNNDDYRRNGGEYDLQIEAHEGEYFERQGWPDQPRILIKDYNYRGATGYGESNSSYYSIDATEKVSLTFHVDKLTSSKYRFVVYDDKNYTTALCQIAYPATQCAAASLDGDNSLYVKATSSAPGGMRFTLHPFDGGTLYFNEGIKGSPLDLGDASINAIHDDRRQVGVQQSLYRVRVKPATVYTLSSRGNVSSIVFDVIDPKSSVSFCTFGFISLNQKQCTIQSSADELLIRAYGGKTTQGGEFQLHVEHGGVLRKNEGALYLPLNLGSDIAINRATETNRVGNYYQLTSATGQSRRIQLTNIVGGNIDLRVYTASEEVCRSESPGLLDENCILPPPTKTTTYTIEITSRFAVEGADFNLRISPL